MSQSEQKQAVELETGEWDAVTHSLLDLADEYRGPSYEEPTELGLETAEELESIVEEIEAQR